MIFAGPRQHLRGIQVWLDSPDLRASDRAFPGPGARMRPPLRHTGWWWLTTVLMVEGWIPEGIDQHKPDPVTITRLEGKRSLALLNGEFDEVDRLDKQLAAHQGAASH
jgi:hypothetical protein